MTSTESTIGGKTVLLKTDTLGRVRMPREKREGLLDEFERSGMSGAAFAKWAGINYPTFATWAQKRRKERGVAGKPTTLEWVEAQVPPAPIEQGEKRLIIQLPGGARMEVAGIGQMALAAEMLRHLESKC
jgi:hypothetical protein